MRKTLALCFLLLTAPAANAQVLMSLIFGESLNSGNVEFGLDGGLNIARFRGIGKSNNHPNWNLGFYFDIKLGDPSLMLHTGVIVKSTLGADNLDVYPVDGGLLDSAFKGGTVTTLLNYFNVPIMLKYRFQNDFYIEGGAMLGLLYGATDELVNTVQESDDLSYSRNVRDAYHPLDAGVLVGVGHRFFGEGGINVSLLYYVGLVDIYIDDATPAKYNYSMYFTVGIPIGAAKDSENEE